MADPKRSLDIEAALRWAFRDELPKREPCPIGASRMVRSLPQVASRAEVGETVTQRMMDRSSNRFGVVPDLAGGGEAHLDAVLIGRAVEDLDSHEIGVPPDWRPLAEMDDLSPEVTRLIQAAVDAISADVSSRTRLFGMKTSALVRRHALAGGAPVWDAQVPSVKVMSTPNGQPMWFVRRLQLSEAVDGRTVSEEVEENGYNPRSKRPYGDAYRKTFLDPDPSEAILGRAEYEVWHAALDALCADLAPRLSSIRLLPSRRAARPWLDGDMAPSVLPDLSDMGPLIPLAPRRRLYARQGDR